MCNIFPPEMISMTGFGGPRPNSRWRTNPTSDALSCSTPGLPTSRATYTLSRPHQAIARNMVSHLAVRSAWTPIEKSDKPTAVPPTRLFFVTSNWYQREKDCPSSKQVSNCMRNPAPVVAHIKLVTYVVQDTAQDVLDSRWSIQDSHEEHLERGSCSSQSLIWVLWHI